MSAPDPDACPSPRPTDLVELLDTVVEAATGTWDPRAVYEEILRRCVRLLDLCDAVVVSRGDDGRPEVMVSTSGDAAVVAILEGYTGQGPCTDALRAGETVLAEESDIEQRWPRVAPELRYRGFSAAAAVPFGDEPTVVGLFAAHPLSAVDCAVARALLVTVSARAALVHEVWSATMLVAQLQEALDSRVAVEQAKGIIAERYGVPVDFAFRLMRDHARSQHVLLHSLAVAVVTGNAAVPGPAAPSRPTA